MSDNQQYNKYVELLQKAADINYASAVLQWDQEVYMPPKGAHFRARQLATLASQAHAILTSNELEQLLDSLKNATDLSAIEAANVLRSFEDLTKNKKLPPAFVEELSMQTSECYNAWIEARHKNDFNIFAPSLTRMVELKKQHAAHYGYDSHPYEALLDDYEPGAKVAILDRVFEGIKVELPLIFNKISAAPQVRDDFFFRHYPKDGQWNFSMQVLKNMGYDTDAGRQDYSEHPFTTSFSPADVRVTTRVSENNFASLLWSSIHEGGHALYEQGLPEAQYGLPLGAAASLGIHESQSRLWENCIGRGSEFWNYSYPTLQGIFPGQLADVTAREFYKASNKVTPSLIRTEADEITYHFHVLIRYELEKSLIEGSLAVKDLPVAWNSLYQKYLGITPPDDRSFGYFPTYTLGSFYAAQFFAQAQQDIPGLNELIAKGDTAQLLAWLREKIHVHGRRYYSDELCELVTGKTLDPAYFLKYAREKYEDVYGIALS
jgi:carboxypeptidase Taq